MIIALCTCAHFHNVDHQTLVVVQFTHLYYELTWLFKLSVYGKIDGKFVLYNDFLLCQNIEINELI